MLTFSLLLAGFTAAQWTESGLATSPAVLPPPTGHGTGTWADAYSKARKLVAQLTTREKSNITYGFPESLTSCEGASGSLPAHGFPGFCFHDGAAGLTGTDMVNAYPAGIHMGATWSRELMKANAIHMGAEFKKKSVHIALGPVIGPMGRVVLGGRNWEGYGPDPYLSGALGFEATTGLQESVITAVKHLVANEQESNRQSGKHPSVSSNIDDTAMHELYMWPFQDVVRAGTACIMCSYQRLNNTLSCENSKLLNGLLKTELGFQGFVLTDWAAHASPGSAKAGLDMFMPWDGPFEFLARNATADPALNSRLDDMATRILAAWFKLNMDQDFPAFGIGMPANITKQHKVIDARDKASKPSRFQAAVEGHVLVKNKNNILPLKSPKILCLYGYNGIASAVNMYYPTAVPSLSRWLLGFLSLDVPDETLYRVAVMGAGAAELTTNGTGILPNSARKGHLFHGGGSGSATPSYIAAPFNEVQQRAIEDDTQLYWDFTAQDPNVHSESDACLVFINEFATEAEDRPSLADPWSDKLVENVAKKCRNTIVAINNAGIRLLDAWIEHPNVTAVIFSHLPGQDSGKALVEILYGKQSPSGRLPYTVAKRTSDYGHMLHPQQPSNNPQSTFTEGVFIDYRYFMAKNITPLYEFGYGLSYTTFKYSDLEINLLRNTVQSVWPPQHPTLDGGNPALFTPIATVEVKVQNTGNMDSSEVVQLYLGLPGNDRPERQLRGFAKPFIEKGQTKAAKFELTRRDLSSWNPEKQDWELRRGEYKVYIGASVLDIKLRGTFSLSSTA